MSNNSEKVTASVDGSNTAKAVGSGSLEVFATPMMIALMERAACQALAGSLEEGQTSVGTMINVEHVSASPIGATISATAAIDGVFGRRVEFSVTAMDGETVIGRGKHTRMIVDRRRFMEKLEKRG
jgi:predicted thioesterase